MRRCIMLASVLLALAAPASAQTPRWVTKADYVFCATLQELKEQTRILVSGDREAWMAYLRNSSCAFTKAGARVYMENAPGIGIIKIRTPGSTVWFYTATEAVRSA